MYFYQPRTGRFERNSRSIRASTVGPAPRRRGLEDDMLYVPHRAPSRAKYDTSANEYSTQADINRELVLSANTMEDNYVLSNKSRQRDRDVLAAANRAIVDTEIHSSPRSAVATRRVMRGRSMPPAPVTHYARPEVPVAFARASPNKLRYSVPPASAPSPRSRYPRVVVKPRYRNFVPVRSTRGLTSSTGSEGQRRAPLSYLAYLRNLESVLMNKRSRASTFVPVRAVKKAALLASKVDTMLPTRVRRPKSKYAQEKLRQIRRDKRESGQAVDPVAVLPIDESKCLKASPPVNLTSARRIWRNEYTSHGGYMY